MAEDAQDDFDIPDSPPSGEGEAAPASAPSGGAAAGASLATAAEPAQPAAEENPHLEELRAARLREIPGEKPGETLARLTDHYRGRAVSHLDELRAERQARKELRDQMQALRTGLEPMLREHFERNRQAKIEAAAASIPDKETDPQGYAIWLAEENLRRQNERDLNAQDEAERAQKEEELAEIDDAGFGELAAGLGQQSGVEADPLVVEAYEAITRSAMEAARMSFPEASDEQLMQFISYAQQLDVRRWKSLGYDVREALKERYKTMREIFGAGARAQAAATPHETAPANGHGEAPATAASPPPAPAAAQTPSPTAARVAAEAVAAARRQPVTGVVSPRPAGLPGQLPDPDSFEDGEDYVEAALAGLLGDAEARTAKHRRARS